MRLLFPTLLLLLLRSAALLAQHPAAPAGTGLRGQYYDGREFEQLVLTRLDATIDFDWSYGPHAPGQPSPRFVAPGPGVPGEVFSVRWTGYLRAPATGLYTLQIATDDGMRVWLDNKLVLNEWRNQWVSRYAARVHLTAGRYYSLRVEYYQVHFDTRALLAWQTPALTTPSVWARLLTAVGLGEADPTPIPTRYLYPLLPAAARPRAVPVPPPQAAGLPAPAVVAPPLVAKAAPVTRARQPAPAAHRLAGIQPLTGRRPQVAATDTAAPAPALPELRGLAWGEARTLPDLYFTRSTAALLPASYPTLNVLARTLRQQPALRLEIAGHTDNFGDARLNQRLSEQRAQVVRRYLVQQGIDSVRLTAVGYGGTRPVADNRDPRQRPRNRRVEVVGQ